MATCNGQTMGLGVGLDNSSSIIKRKFQWLLKITGVSVEDSATVKALPPRRSSRPSLTWKEIDFQHLTEQIHYPMKPTWEPIDLILYDICRGGSKCNPVFLWIARSLSGSGNGIYNPQTGSWSPVVNSGIKRQGTILILDGCGNTVERWTLDNCYPHQVRWGELDMDQSDVMTCECSLRYDRAYCDLGQTITFLNPFMVPNPLLPLLNPIQNPNVQTQPGPIAPLS